VVFHSSQLNSNSRRRLLELKGQISLDLNSSTDIIRDTSSWCLCKLIPLIMNGEFGGAVKKQEASHEGE